MGDSGRRDVWILGAAGRAGRAIAAELAGRDVALTLVGRDEADLRAVAASLSIDANIVVASALGEIGAAIAGFAPRVVINTIGPFARTATRVVRACPPGTHYVDVGNELPALLSLYAMHEELVATNRCVVHGAGWGVLATESVVYRLCAGRPVPLRVRVDNVAAVETTGPLGRTLANGILDGIAFGGRRYAGGRLKFAFAGSDHIAFQLPDGSTVKTGLLPTAELEAAYRASGAPEVVAGFPGAPAGPSRFALPIVALLLAIPAIRRFALARLAKLQLPPARQTLSWARARVEWSDGKEQTAWLSAGDGYVFLAKAAAGVTQRLLDGQGKPGCFTPGALFGSALAEEAGGTFVTDPAMGA